MIKALQKLRELSEGARHDYEATLLDFSPLDEDEVAKNLDIDKVGLERGKEEQPASTAKSLDAIESKIVERIEAYRAKAIEQLTGQIGICADRMRQLKFDSLLVQVRSEARSTINDFESEARNGENELFQLRRELLEATEALEHFKTSNKLARPAHQKANSLVTGVILLGVFLIETLANAGLMGDAHEGGFIGAYALAVALSFINVCVGFGAGYLGLRSAFHRNFFRKLLGLASVLLYGGAIFIFNLYVAHVRDAMQSTEFETALKSVWAKVMDVSIDFVDFQAPVMLAVGVLFSLIAFYKGYSIDDPYPDYGRQSRLRDDCEITYTDTAKQLSDELNERRDEIKDVLNRVANELDFRKADYRSILSTAKRLNEKYKAHERHLGSVLATLIERYRTANRKGRNTPEPKYFQKSPTLSRAGNADTSVVDEIYSNEDVEKVIKEGVELLELSIDQIGDAHQVAFNRYSMISQVLDRKALEALERQERIHNEATDGTHP